MRIVLDLQAIQAPANRSRGIGRAYRSLVREIILQREEHECLVVISGILYDYAEEIWHQLSDIMPIENFHVWHGTREVSWHEARSLDVFAYQRQINTILYQAYLAGLKPDVVLFGNFCDGYHDACLLPVPATAYEIPVVMICYDLIPLVYPELYDDRSGNGFIDFYRLRLAHLKNADHVFAISDSVKNDIVRFLDYPADKITTTSLGFTEIPGAALTSSRVEEVCRKYNIRKPFILYVSTQDPRKNHVGVIEAFARLAPEVRDAYQIVFAGSNFIDEGRLSNALQDNDLPRSSLSIAIHPSDEDLQILYKLAHLGIFPSLYEGFGLGILESMAYGLPVIASNTSAMPEVMGREDALFDPTDPDNMASKMAQGLTDDAFRADLVRHGREHIKKWDWARCGKRAIRAFEKVYAADVAQCVPFTYSAREWAIKQLGALPMPDMSAADTEAVLANAATAIELTYPTPLPIRRQRIFVDVSEFVHYDYNTGIQRVIKCLVIEMARQLKEIELSLVYSHADGIGYHHARNLQEHLLNGRSRRPFAQETTERVVFSNGDILLHSELTMPQVVRQRFYLQDLRRLGVKTVFIVYDLIPIKYSFHEGHHGKEAMLNWLSCLLQSDKIVAISRATDADIRACVAEYDLPFQSELELDWFHLGGDFHNYIHEDTAKRESSSQVLHAFYEAQIARLTGKTNFLMVGTIEPRKGHADMLRAMEVLWANGIDVNLIVVGKMGWLDEKQLSYIRAHPESGRRFFMFNDMSDDQLNEIYGLSSCLLYFSKVEGFGLPLIEAAQHGLPIIARNAPVFREVCGEHAFYFPDGVSPTEVARYIERWLQLYKKDEHPKSEGMPWLTWKESVRCFITKLLAEPDSTKHLPERKNLSSTDAVGQPEYVR